MGDGTVRILLVEDNPGDARLLRESLRDAEGLSSEVTQVQCLDQAIQRLRTGEFDVLLLDLSLPDSEGTDTVKRMIDASPHVPVVVLTGIDDEAVGTEAVRCGAQDYLVKGQTDCRLLTRAIRYAIERQRAETALEAAKADAEHASRAKDHFLAVLSHELRTPLAPVVATISMLQDQPQFDVQTREHLEMIRRNVELEARLIDDLLDVTRISRGKVELDREQVELGTVIQRAVEVCTPDIEARRLHFGVDIQDAPHLVYADAARLQQVFWNLLKNSIKFTPLGGCVGVRCWRENEQVIVEVNDSGVGIEAEALTRIFDAFEQAERSITRQFGGLGLGLTISKAMVEMHGGTISARSGGKGKGATLTVRLPLVQGAAAAEPALPCRPDAAARRPLRILLVEDHGDTARIMRQILAADGHEVEMAADVATALDLARRKSFDLLLSDLGLPDGTGIDLMRQLREQGLVLPGIALSGYGQDQDVARSREAGFAAHLIKPVGLDQLVVAIATVTGGLPPSDSP